MPEPSTRSYMIGVRLNPAERALVERMARRHAMTPSELVRGLIRESAGQRLLPSPPAAVVEA